MRFYSIIIPVYNRPQEVKELLESLKQQTFKDFEVLIIEDGSQIKCDVVVESFKKELKVRYYFKENSGQGFSRNFGYARAEGDYFIVFDSDCIIPSQYLEEVDNCLNRNYLDAYGGPDRAHKNFTYLQKAISFSMTSVFTTGGIRGNKRHMGTFHPRSFNMGISREVFEKTKGYIIPYMGEDIEFSIRITKNGFKTGLIESAFVYHKRRTSLKQFFRQLHFFGRARINISRFYPAELRLTHFFPLCFLIFLLLYAVGSWFLPTLFFLGTILLTIYFLAIFLDALLRNKHFWIAILGLVAAVVQLTAYGIGFATEGFKKIFKG